MSDLHSLTLALLAFLNEVIGFSIRTWADASKNVYM
jgi:hypothetical protein